MDGTKIAAFAALLTALSGIIFTSLSVQREQISRVEQQKQWDDELRKWVTEREIDILHERLKVLHQQRFATYPPVMKTLGAVRDVAGPQHYAALESDPNILLTVSDELIAHLYSPAGFVMSMETRNQLLRAWYACQLFRRKSLPVEALVNVFYQARRNLRADIEINDAEEPPAYKQIIKPLEDLTKK